MDKEYTININTLIIDLLKGLKKFWYLIIILPSILSGIFFCTSVKKYTPIYTAKATFTIQAGYEDANIGYSYSYYYNSQTASQMALTFPYILQSNLLQEIVCQDLNVGYLNGSISAMTIPDTNLFTIIVTSANPQDAYNILNSVIENYPKVAVFVLGDTKMNILSSPKIPSAPRNKPSYSRMTKIGFLAGGVLGMGCIFLYAITRRTIKEPEDLKEKLNIKCLGVMPCVRFKQRNKKVNKLINILNNRVSSSFKESIRSVRTRILKEINNEKSKVIVVTSSIPGEGKTTFSINLALSLAQIGNKVILADGDLRNPSLLMNLDVLKRFKGLGEIVGEDALLEESIQYLPQYQISVVGSYQPYNNATQLITDPLMKYTINELREMADYVIIDTPPCCVVTDAVSISNYADYVIYVVRQDHVRRDKIIDSLTSLSYSKVELLGAVLTLTESGYGAYGYRYGYNNKLYGKSYKENEHAV